MLAQVRKLSEMLNTIIEVDEESSGGAPHDHRPRCRLPESLEMPTQIDDQFPTPRRQHFMPTPHLASDASSAEGSSFSEDSLPWTRDSISTQTTDFDDLYDVSDDEGECFQKGFHGNRAIDRGSLVSDRPARSLLSLPILIIPAASSEHEFPPQYKQFSPEPPILPPKIPMSPAILSFLASQESLSASNPPSLDGSLNSEQLANISPPATPDIDDDVNHHGHWGVHLPAAAMATLQTISGEDALYDQLMEQMIDHPHPSPTIEMQQSPPPTNSLVRRHESVVLPPHQQRFLNSLTRLEIPSPGGFFANLSDESRCTWLFEPIIRDMPPSSSAAEHYYQTPWTQPLCSLSETIVDIPTEYPVSRPLCIDHDSDETIRGVNSEEDVTITEIVEWNDYDEAYVRKLQQTASQYSDRTRSWLAGQESYIANLINPPEERDDEVALATRQSSSGTSSHALSAPDKKIVRFVEGLRWPPSPPKSDLTSSMCIFYEAFLTLITSSHYRDAQVHRLPRFQALQTQRSTFPQAYRDQLLGRLQVPDLFKVVPRQILANLVCSDASDLVEDPSRVKASQQREAITQMTSSIWSIEALKMLNDGRLLQSPIIKRLARSNPVSPRVDIPSHIRILDLGGQSSCDWAWHLASSYPYAHIHTVVGERHNTNFNDNIDGPQNHFVSTTSSFTQFPFPDCHFDCISARSMHSLLRTYEWSTCLSEVYRILKPGGFLEFRLLDCDILNAGPLGTIKCAEFSAVLGENNFEPCPTTSFIARLYGANFTNIKRAWSFLPMGAPNPPRVEKRDTFGVEIKDRIEGIQDGSTENVAPLTGLLGAIEWERWMAYVDASSGGTGALLRGNWDVFEEGRKIESGWRVLSGWAVK